MLTSPILKAIIERINYPVVITDTNGKYALWNEAAMDIIGEKVMAVGVGTMERFTVFKMDGVRYTNDQFPIMRAILYGESSKKEKMYVKDHKTGTGKYLEVDAFPIYNQEGTLVAAAASFHDITQALKTEKFIEEITKTLTHMKTLIENSFFT